MLSYTRLHDLTIYVDQSVDVSCTAAEGRAAAGSCGVSRPLETNSIFSPGGNGLTSTLRHGRGLGCGQLRDRDAGGHRRRRQRVARGRD
jgi:hypothetical protein